MVQKETTCKWKGEVIEQGFLNEHSEEFDAFCHNSLLPRQCSVTSCQQLKRPQKFASSSLSLKLTKTRQILKAVKRGQQQKQEAPKFVLLYIGMYSNVQNKWIRFLSPHPTFYSRPAPVTAYGSLISSITHIDYMYASSSQQLKIQLVSMDRLYQRRVDCFLLSLLRKSKALHKFIVLKTINGFRVIVSVLVPKVKCTTT